jgi:hypothetical protein
LLKAGIAPRHVRRYLRELNDHLADLKEAQLETGHDGHEAGLRARALLGGDEELATAMLAQPSLKSWAARWPWLFFAVLPPLSSLASFFLLALPLVLFADAHRALTHTLVAPIWLQSLTGAMTLFANLALSPTLAAFIVWTAARQRLNWKWPLLAITIIALAGFHMVAHFPTAPQKGGQIAITALQIFRLTGHYPEPAWAILAQFFLTLAPALWLLKQRFADAVEPR